MKRKLNLDQVYKSFEQEDLVDIPEEKNDKGVVTKEAVYLNLKRALLLYIRSSQAMNTTNEEQTSAYDLGIKIGTSTGELILNQVEYDLIKKLVDYSKVRTNDQRELPLWDIERSQQTKRIIDTAEGIEE